MIESAHRSVDLADLDPGMLMVTDAGRAAVEQVNKVPGNLVEVVAQIGTKRSKWKASYARDEYHEFVIVPDEETLAAIERAVVDAAIGAGDKLYLSSAGGELVVEVDGISWGIDLLTPPEETVPQEPDDLDEDPSATTD